jgi:Xaa-Pro aminopeptidase
MFARDDVLDRIYPEFPSSEYEHRNKRARESMEKHGVDVLLTTELKNTEYFTGCMVCIGPNVAIVPADVEPVLLIPSFLSGTAEKTAWTRNVRKHSAAHIKNDPNGFARFIVDVLKELGYEKATIGLEYGEDLSAGLQFSEFDFIRANMKDAKFVSGADVLWDCRMIKSPLEIERLTSAAEIVMKGYDVARQSVKIGMTEIEVAEIYKSFYVKEQARRKHNTHFLGYFNIRAGPERYPMADTFNQDRKTKSGETLVMNVGAWYRRYYANWSRFAFLGTPTEKHMRAHNAIEESIKIFNDELAPGRAPIEIHEKTIAPLKECKCGEVFDHTGIGVGMYQHEPPYIGEGREDVIKPGMVFCLQSWIYDVGEGGMGVLGYEHEFVVTDKGSRPLVPLEDELLWVIK